MNTLTEPQRTCIGCRQRGPAAEMARLALSAGRVVPWAKGAAGSRPTGRGASLHPTEACVRKAFKTGAFARAFKGRAESLDEADFFHQLTAATAALRREKP